MQLVFSLFNPFVESWDSYNSKLIVYDELIKYFLRIVHSVSVPNPSILKIKYL